MKHDNYLFKLSYDNDSVNTDHTVDSLCFNSSAAEIQPSGAALFCPVFGGVWCSAAQPTYTGTICRMYCT